MKRLLLATALALFCTPANAQVGYSELEAYELGVFFATAICNATGDTDEELLRGGLDKMLGLPAHIFLFAKKLMLDEDPSLKPYRQWYLKGLDDVTKSKCQLRSKYYE